MYAGNYKKLVGTANLMSTFEEFKESMDLAKKCELAVEIRLTDDGLDVKYDKIARVLISKVGWLEDYFKVLKYLQTNDYHIINGGKLNAKIKNNR